MLHDSGFQIVATHGTALAIARMGIPVQRLNKLAEGSPHVVDWIDRGDVDLVVNTPTGSGARADGREIRRAAVAHGIPCLTTLAAGVSAARAIAGREPGRAGCALPAGAPRPARRARAGAAGEPPRRRGRGGVSARSEGQARMPAGSARSHRSRRRAARHRQRAPRRLPAAEGGRPRRPGAAGRPVRHARGGGALGRGRGRAPLTCRAPSRSRALADGEAHYLLEDVGPGTRRLCELTPGERAVDARAARQRLSPARRAAGARAARRRRRRDRPACDPAGPAGGAYTPSSALWAPSRHGRARVLLGFRDAARAAGAGLLRDARLASDDGSVGHAGLVTDLLAAELDGRPTRSSTPVARRRCSRRSGRFAPSARFPPSWRWRPAWRAASARASAAPCPAAAAASCASASMAP